MSQQDAQKQAPDIHQSAVLKLIGVGGGGCNAIQQMIAADIHDVEFTCVNTDAQALANYDPAHVIQLGNNLTRGLGAGADPEVGRMAAEESGEQIGQAIGNADMLFLTAGMGGGTGTGAIPVVAKIAREMGVLTVAVVTKPFAFEGEKRKRVAEAGLVELRKHVDSLIVVPNENLLTHLGPDISLIDAFSASNDILTNAVQSIAELITNTGLINVDFADVKSVMTEMGQAIMSTGRGIGENRAYDAAVSAIESPLLDEIDLKEARGILANITASSDLSMGEFHEVGDIIRKITADDANVVIGTVFDQRMKNEMRVTVVATGLKVPDSNTPKKPVNKQSNKTKSKPQQKSKPTVPAVPATSAAIANTAKPSEEYVIHEKPEETCIVCANPLNNHKEKCPLAVGQQEVETADENLSQPTIQQQYIEAEANKYSQSQKMSLAGIAAGFVALVSIFYVAATDKFSMQDTLAKLQGKTTVTEPQITKPAETPDYRFSGFEE